MTIEPGQNTGVIIVPTDPLDFVAGGETGIVEITRNTSGDWRNYESPGEWQKDMTVGFETDACVSFSANDTLQTLGNFEIAGGFWSADDVSWLKTNGYLDTNNKLHFSDRFTAKMSGTTTAGNSLPAVWNSIAENGLVPESMWPFPVDQINASPSQAWSIYYSAVPANVIALGKEFLTRFQIQSEWLCSSGQGMTPASYAKALQIAPIQIATAVCSPWNTDLPIQGCGTGAAHATQLSFVDSSVYRILDHYVPFDKELALNYTLSYSMRGIISPVTDVVTPAFNHVFSTNLLYGMGATSEVHYLQEALQILKDHNGNPYMTPGVFGIYGNITKTAVAALQRDNGILDDGTHFGIKTRTAVNNLLVAGVGDATISSMNTLKSIFSSPAVLSYIGLFLDGGLKAVEPSTPIWLQGIIGLVIVALGTYFHFGAVNAAAKTGAAKK